VTDASTVGDTNSKINPIKKEKQSESKTTKQVNTQREKKTGIVQEVSNQKDKIVPEPERSSFT
jgi:hypothetical protein